MINEDDQLHPPCMEEKEAVQEEEEEEEEEEDITLYKLIQSTNHPKN